MDFGVTLVRNADRKIERLAVVEGRAKPWASAEELSRFRGGFNPAHKAVYLRKNATAFEAFHEMQHALQFAKLKGDTYKMIGGFAREKYVYNQIMKNKYLFNSQEIAAAQNYMSRLIKRRELVKKGAIDEPGFLPKIVN